MLNILHHCLQHYYSGTDLAQTFTNICNKSYLVTYNSKHFWSVLLLHKGLNGTDTFCTSHVNAIELNFSQQNEIHHFIMVYSLDDVYIKYMHKNLKYTHLEY